MGLRTSWRPGDKFLVRHQDGSVVVVEKRAGLLTHAGPEQDEPSLLSLLRAFLGDRPNDRRRHLRAVHRLDRVVSGLLVFARTDRAFEALRGQFAARTVERSYLAAIAGQPAWEQTRLEDELDVGPMTVRVAPGHPEARVAITHAVVQEKLQTADASLLEVRLETGLRNQIRVQLAHHGHPLLGERKYRPDRPRAQGQVRIFLHAARLGFSHPFSGQALRFEAPLPPDLSRWRAALRRGPAPHCPAPRRP